MERYTGCTEFFLIKNICYVHFWIHTILSAIYILSGWLAHLWFYFDWQDAELLQCLCVWILTSVDEDIAQEATSHINECPGHHTWNLYDLSILWKILLQKCKIRPLIRGFQLFQQVRQFEIPKLTWGPTCDLAVPNESTKTLLLCGKLIMLYINCLTFLSFSST